MEILLTRYHWLQLSVEQRQLMRDIFQIPRSKGVEMMGNKILSDGSDENDLKAVNIESMRTFLGQESVKLGTFELLFNATIEKIDSIFLDRETERQLELQKENTTKRVHDTQEVVENVLATIENLPLDAQVQIVQALSDLSVKQIGDTTIKNVPVKKAGRPKKVEESSN